MGLAGRGLAGHLRLGTCFEYRHPVDEAVGGALRGRRPRTREGRIGPTAPMRRERIVLTLLSLNYRRQWVEIRQSQ